MLRRLLPLALMLLAAPLLAQTAGSIAGRANDANGAPLPRVPVEASSRALQTGRSYASIAQVVPGVSSDANPDPIAAGTISVYGSSGAENAFYIDGVNTTGIEYGFQGKELNFEFVQEVQVKTGGYEAEFGRST